MVCAQPWEQSVASSGALLPPNREVNKMTSEVLHYKEGCELVRSYMNGCVVPPPSLSYCLHSNQGDP